MARLFKVGFRDNKGTQNWRETDDKNILTVWQPFRAKASLYDLYEVQEVLGQLASLKIGESLIIERVEEDTKV